MGQESGHPRGGGDGASTRILVVDDDRESAELLAELLAAHGYAVDAVTDAATALERSTSWRPALAILDIGLPVMTGNELAAKLRAHPDLCAVKLVALTGYDARADRDMVQVEGFDAIVGKPVDVDQLSQLIEKLLRD